MKAIRIVEDINSDATFITCNNRKVGTLYFEDDGDHAAMQRGNGKMGYIVYVYEGIEKVSKGRNRLLNVRYFTVVKIKNDDMWIDVANYIEELMIQMFPRKYIYEGMELHGLKKD